MNDRYQLPVRQYQCMQLLRMLLLNGLLVRVHPLSQLQWYESDRVLSVSSAFRI